MHLAVELAVVDAITTLMRVSWSDLNNVTEAGDLPFRDGRITVTSAEIAFWKQSPDAAFRLMRKHPVQGEPRYMLGQPLPEAPEPAGNQLFYTSSNGDSWSLARDASTGEQVVMHVPNLQSGGSTSHTEIRRFLADGANGPEHQALRRWMQAARSGTILIAYDIHPSKGAAYDELAAAIQSLGVWWHHLETVWIVRSGLSTEEMREKLKPHIGAEDQLLIIDVTGDEARWAGVSDSGSEWLQQYVVRGNDIPAGT